MNKPSLREILWVAIICAPVAIVLVSISLKQRRLTEEKIQLTKELVQKQDEYKRLIEKYLEQTKEFIERTDEKIRLTEMLTTSLMSSVYDANPQDSCPLWPMPGNGREEIYHFVDRVLELEGLSMPYQVYMLTNVETSIVEIGIMRHPQSFPESSVLETKVGEKRVLSAEEADVVLKKFGRK